MDFPVKRETLAFPVFLAALDNLGCLACLAIRENLVCPDRLDFLEFLDPLETRASPVSDHFIS